MRLQEEKVLFCSFPKEKKRLRLEWNRIYKKNFPTVEAVKP